MKKIILFILLFLTLTNNTYALSINEKIEKLENNINELKNSTEDLKNNKQERLYPIGSIYITTTYSSASQVGEALGGTWEAYSQGRTLVGINPDDEQFNALGKSGGNSTTVLSINNLPSHTHNIPALSGTTNSAGAHIHNNTAKSSTISGKFGASVPPYHSNYASGAFKGITYSTNDSNRVTYPTTTGRVFGYKLNATPTITVTNASAGSHTHTVTTKASTSEATGSGTSFTNLQPYITVYMWKRTA